MTRQVERDAALAALRARRVNNLLFAADLFNEVWTCRDVDTILFLQADGERHDAFGSSSGRGYVRARANRC